MKRKAEGIALLSLYNDDEEEEEDEEEEVIPAPSPSEAPGVADSDAAAGGASGIVDYAHDEAAMSPEAEEGEIENTGRAVVSSAQVDSSVVEKLPIDGDVVTPETLAAPTETDTDAATLHQEPTQEEQAAEENGTSNAEMVDLDLLSDFLPPPPTSKCSDELQSKFARYLALKNAGRSFNEELRNSKGYRNPDFLQHAVIYRGIDQIGSCFKKDIFDPHGYDPDDFYDALTLQQTRELERKDQERKQSQRVEFVRATSAITTAAAADSRSKSLVQMVQKSGVIAASIASSNDNTGKPEGRSKKSKWDKVDTETRTVSNLSLSAQNALAAATAHAALLSANAGAGYILSQQKRKEEEKSKTEKGFKSDRKADRS